MAEQLCEMCGQPWPTKKKKRRECSKCKQPIGKRHKYFFEGSTVQHYNCDDPTTKVVK
jgi:hypothetical protein